MFAVDRPAGRKGRRKYADGCDVFASPWQLLYLDWTSIGFGVLAFWFEGMISVLYFAAADCPAGQRRIGRNIVS